MNNKLFVLIGEMGSGKSTILKELLLLIKEEDDIKLLKSHTTRKPRSSELNKESEYIFADKAKFTKDFKNDEILEYASYNMATEGEVFYYTHKNDLDLDIHSYIKIMNPVGFSQLTDSIPDDKLISFRISADEATRLSRTLKRGDNQSEVERRIKADEKDFRHLTTTYIVDNSEEKNITQLAKTIYDIIKEEAR